jgi:hypothetical protein
MQECRNAGKKDSTIREAILNRRDRRETRRQNRSSAALSVLGGSFFGFVKSSRLPALRAPDSRKKRATDETRIEHRFTTGHEIHENGRTKNRGHGWTRMNTG